MADGCDRIATERGLCHGHYLRLTRNGNLEEDRPLARQKRVCDVETCDRIAELNFGT